MPLCSGYDNLEGNTNSEMFISKYGEFGGLFFQKPLWKPL
jgi:hypothetical protein